MAGNWLDQGIGLSTEPPEHRGPRLGQATPGYQLIRLRGRGGFAEVWEAEAPGGFRVALKLMRSPAKKRSAELRAIEVIRGIRHINLLPIFGAWQVDDLLVMDMELADRSLWDRFREATASGLRGIPRAELLRYLSDAAAGIDFLNGTRLSFEGRTAVGIQHRDLKPQNILLVGGCAKVADFGMLRVMERSVASHTGAWTLPYAAPEFFHGQTAQQSDQYSLAVTYCQLRGGRLPFRGTPAEIVSGHLFAAPQLQALPEPERAIVERALAKHPSDRWPDCRQFMEALRSAGETAEIPDALITEGSNDAVDDDTLIRESDTEAPSSVPVAPAEAADLLLWSSVDDIEDWPLNAPAPPDQKCGDVLAPAAADSWVPPEGVFASLSTSDSIQPCNPPLQMPDSPASVVKPSGEGQKHRWGRYAAGLLVALLAICAVQLHGISSRSPRATAAISTNSAIARPGVLDLDHERKRLLGEEPSAAVARLTRHGTNPKWNAENLLQRNAFQLEPASPGAGDTRPPQEVAERRKGAETLSTPPRAPELELPETVHVRIGQQVGLPILVKRGGDGGLGSLEFQNVPPGIGLSCPSISQNDRNVTATLRVAKDAPPGETEVLVALAGRPEKRLGRFRLLVLSSSERPALERGRDALRRGDHRGAVVDFTEAIRQDPKHAEAFYLRGLAKQRDGQWSGALADYSEAIKRQPDHAGALLLRGRVRQEMRATAPAIVDFTEAIRYRPGDPLGYLARGKAYHETGAYKKALSDFTEAIRLSPDDASVYYRRGLVRYHTGDNPGAINDFTRAIDLDPKLANALRARSEAFARLGDHTRAAADRDRFDRMVSPESAQDLNRPTAGAVLASPQG